MCIKIGKNFYSDFVIVAISIIKILNSHHELSTFNRPHVILNGSEVLRVKHRETSKTCVYAGIYDGIFVTFLSKSYFSSNHNKASLKSFQSEFILLINAVFLSRLYPFNCFSRDIASVGLLYSSKYTSLCV